VFSLFHSLLYVCFSPFALKVIMTSVRRNFELHRRYFYSTTLYKLLSLTRETRDVLRPKWYLENHVDMSFRGNFWLSMNLRERMKRNINYRAWLISGTWYLSTFFNAVSTSLKTHCVAIKRLLGYSSLEKYSFLILWIIRQT
jgi:hypothetical protein